MKVLEFIKKSFLAGMMISIGGYIYLSVSNNYLGAFLFSIGLFFIILCSLNLYTGKVGYMVEQKNYVGNLLIFLINVCACILMGVVLRAATDLQVIDKVSLLVKNKLDLNLFIVFIKSFFCGCMIYIAVEGSKRINDYSGKIFIIVVSVMTFILSGFEHSIADAFYLAIANEFSFKALLFLIIVGLGNGVGSIFFHYILKQVKKEVKPNE